MSKITINILTLTLLAVLVWIEVQVYFSVKKDYNQDLDKFLTKQAIEPLNPILDLKNMDMLKRNYANFLGSDNSQPTNPVLPKATPTPRS